MQNKFYKTNDGGQTLQLINNTNFGYALFYISKDTGWGAGEFLHQTTDIGSNFLRYPTDLGNYNYIIQFMDKLHGWIAGTNIYKTLDGGNTIDTHIYTPNFSALGGDVHFFDASNGYIYE